ncbi:hypothetical protein FMM68_11815 [Lachnospiraceae bacterium MD329]|nr:hypothetical protein [Lachnospiraceae bacterium MD329]
MKIKYDVQNVPECRHGGQQSEEILSVIAFLASKHKNICFEYDNEKECTRGCESIRGYRRRNKLQDIFSVSRRGNCFYVVKLKKKNTEHNKEAAE